MAFTRTYSTTPKGKFKCFKCRELCMSKNGDWHASQGNQVFLCKACVPIVLGQSEKPKFLLH